MIGLRVYDSSYINQVTGFHSVIDNEFIDQTRAMRISYTQNLIAANNKMTGCGITLFGYDHNEWTTHTIETSNLIDGKPVYYIVGEDDPQSPEDAGELIFADCTNIAIKDRSFGSGLSGIILGVCEGISIEDVEFSDSYVGVLAAWSHNLDVQDVVGQDMYAAAYFAGCVNVTVKDCRFDRCSYGGIVMDGSSTGHLFDNILNEAPMLLYSLSWSNVTGNEFAGGTTGIQLYSGFRVNITRNTLNGLENGVTIYDSRGCLLRENTCTDGSNGFFLDYSSEIEIDDNLAENNKVGIRLSYSDLNLMINNRIINNRIGIMCNHSDSNDIFNSTISGNKLSGAMLNRTIETRFMNNLFSNNTGYAIAIDPEAPFDNFPWYRFENSSENLFYFNSFENNNAGGTQALDNGYNNQWNENIGGNLWSEWTGPDQDEDGFVDDPYHLDGTASSKDLLPLSVIPKTDTDGDGFHDHVEEMFQTDIYDNRSHPPDADGDLLPNEIDPDIDGDGKMNEEDRDMDGDGRDNEDDLYPKDPDRWEEEEEGWSVLGMAFFAAIVLLVLGLFICLIVVLVKRRKRAKDSPDIDRIKDGSEEKEGTDSDEVPKT